MKASLSREAPTNDTVARMVHNSFISALSDLLVRHKRELLCLYPQSFLQSMVEAPY